MMTVLALGLLTVVGVWVLWKLRATTLAFVYLLPVWPLMLLSCLRLDAHSWYAGEIDAQIGGVPGATARLCLIYAIHLLVFGLWFSPARLRRLDVVNLWNARRAQPIERPLFAAGLGVFLLFVVSGYFLLFQHPIPLFSGIGRVDYKAAYGSPWLGWFYTYKDFFAMLSGAVLMWLMLGWRSRQDKAKAGQTGLIGVLLVSMVGYYLYFFLIGNKYSSPLVFAMFVVMMFAPVGARCWKVLGWRTAAVGAVVAVAIMLAPIPAAFSNYFAQHLPPPPTTTRNGGQGHGASQAAIQEKMVGSRLKQEAELWWWYDNAVARNGRWYSGEAWRTLFEKPFLRAQGNITLHYLATGPLGKAKARVIFAQGSPLTGAYPTVLTAMGGRWGQYVLAALAALAVSVVTYVLLLCVVHRFYVSMFFMTFVAHPLMLFILAGNLLFLYQRMYMLKLLLAGAALVVEVVVWPRLSGLRESRRLVLFGQSVIEWGDEANHKTPRGKTRRARKKDTVES